MVYELPEIQQISLQQVIVQACSWGIKCSCLPLVSASAMSSIMIINLTIMLAKTQDIAQSTIHFEWAHQDSYSNKLKSLLSFQLICRPLPLFAGQFLTNQVYWLVFARIQQDHISFYSVYSVILQFFCLAVSMARALVIVDVQNDFCEGGTLAVPKSLEIFPYLNKLKKLKNFFSLVVLTRDWHPAKHVSFASTHNKQPFTSIQIDGKAQQLWPDHCVANTRGAEISPLLEIDPNDIIVNKGTQLGIDSYSGFELYKKDNQLKTRLQNANIEQIYVCGLAFDYCVGSTALDANKFGFKTFIIEQATKSVNVETQRVMKQRLKDNKVQIISYEQLKEQ